MEVNLRIVGLVLAGGQSERMGRDKAQLTLANQSLLSRSVKLLQNVGLTDVFVSGNYPDFNCITDVTPYLGPVSGLAASVKQLAAGYDALLVIPVDMPLLSVQACIQLIEQFNCQESPKTGLYHQQSIFPLLLPITEQLTDYLEKVMLSKQRRERSIFRLLESLEVQETQLQGIDLHCFDNTNTPSEWQQCQSRFQANNKE